MTLKEAKNIFGLKDTDTLQTAGIKSLIDSVEAQLAVWSISKYDRAELEKEREALQVLLTEATN